MSRPLHGRTGSPIVIDTSVAFKWFDTTEPGSDTAEELLDAHGRDEIALLAPAHLPLEILNVHASRHASLQRMTEVIDDLASVGLLIAPLDDTLLAEAARIAFTDRLALYDAAFIALAALLDAPLVTADRRQATATACEVRLIR